MGAIINERDRVCSHGIHHNLGGTEFIDMGSIIVEGGHSVDTCDLKKLRGDRVWIQVINNH